MCKHYFEMQWKMCQERHGQQIITPNLRVFFLDFIRSCSFEVSKPSRTIFNKFSQSPSTHYYYSKKPRSKFLKRTRPGVKAATYFNWTVTHIRVTAGEKFGNPYHPFSKKFVNRLRGHYVVCKQPLALCSVSTNPELTFPLPEREEIELELERERADTTEWQQRISEMDVQKWRLLPLLPLLASLLFYYIKNPLKV